MSLLYASTFADALGKLTHQEQKQVKITTVDLLMDPKGSGLSLERLTRAADDKIWSARVSRDLRIIMRRDGEDTLLAYVGHHDDAYGWAERRKFLKHERTGSMQIVEVIEKTGGEDGHFDWSAGRQTEEPTSTDKVQPFWALSEDDLLDVGVPREWLDAVREMAEEDLDRLFDHLPAEAAEALYDFATGGSLEDHKKLLSRASVSFAEEVGHSGSKDALAFGFVKHMSEGSDTSAYTHPDARRRFRVIENVEELIAALDAPFEKWAVFLHPAQRALVEKRATGPTRVTGSAGTGKTIVALHRAVHLARLSEDARVLLTTFSQPLSDALERKLELLTEALPQVRERIAVKPIDAAAIAIYSARFGKPVIADDDLISKAIETACEQGLGGDLSKEFLAEEWSEIVDAWGVEDAETYAKLPRVGRRTRLGPKQREAAWAVFEHLLAYLGDNNLVTPSMIYRRLADDPTEMPFDHVVVDEAQDLTVAQVGFLGSLAGVRADAVFLAGDIGQRIFRLPFSWTRLGLDIRGRSHSLKVNYRTSHQIRATADKLLPPSITDMDGVEEGRRGTVSVFDGPEPQLIMAGDEEEERRMVSSWLADCLSTGIKPIEIGILVRSDEQIDRARRIIGEVNADQGSEKVQIATMHGAKGLEFRAVAVVACDEDVLPDQQRMASIGDINELETAYETERHLLYVACTRARDRLLVSCVSPGSEFLDDLRPKPRPSTP
ncbi:3'-5' exonuclease [Erythrobacter sp.]|uniref:3'-5' exonuclease n=1 Tax=Erythrobacter sp. TaxID=1042 RepID=UPI001425E9E0|nr:3'-5' exonuclease [Erythrobacter sp.]QIQ86380.1 MAG: AAA family ATPase [Erythrobacter sp.]